VPNIGPIAVASANVTSGMAPLPVVFSSAGSNDPDGSITSYRWDFGDGTSSTSPNPSKTYNTAGNFTATLTVWDNSGANGTVPLAITVSAPPNTPPIAVINASTTSGVAPLAVTFTSTGSKDPDGTIKTYKWEFGDGTTSTSANPPAKNYNTPG